jgi:prephenate dehydratase
VAVNDHPRVAFQGEAGAFGELAIARRWRSGARALGTATFAAAIDLLVDGGSEYAVIPVWNSTIGNVDEAQRALRDREARIDAFDEVVTPVRHALLARPTASRDSIRYVGSHPVALRQCARLFERWRSVSAVTAYDTAGAARELDRFAARVHVDEFDTGAPWYATLPDASEQNLAVIASATVAARYGLVVLDDGVQDDPQNATRFVVLRRRGDDRC